MRVLKCSILYTNTHTQINKNKMIPFMSRGPASLKMLGGNQRILGAAQVPAPVTCLQLLPTPKLAPQHNGAAVTRE